MSDLAHRVSPILKPGFFLSTNSISHFLLQPPQGPFNPKTLSQNPFFSPSRMSMSRVFFRVQRSSLNQFRYLASSSSLSPRNDLVPNLANKWTHCAMSQVLDHSFLGKGILQRFGISSSASPQPNEKEINQSKDGHGSVTKNDSTSQDASQNKNHHEKDSGSTLESKLADSESVKKRRGRKSTKRTAFSDSDTESDLSFDDLVKLVAEKEELLKEKQEEVEVMHDKVLRSYAEMENVIGRTKREAENSKKFAIQNFAKSLLDVADNLERASSVVKESFSKIDQSKDSVGAVPLLKTLLEGVEMTNKQLAEVFRKFGVEKFDPLNEQFDPNRHLAVFQVPDPSKPAGTIAAVLKAGYMLYDRVIRPAEVGVSHGGDEADQSSDA